jgi:hypothetical protein
VGFKFPLRQHLDHAMERNALAPSSWDRAAAEDRSREESRVDLMTRRGGVISMPAMGAAEHPSSMSLWRRGCENCGTRTVVRPPSRHSRDRSRCSAFRLVHLDPRRRRPQTDAGKSPRKIRCHPARNGLARSRARPLRRAVSARCTCPTTVSGLYAGFCSRFLRRNGMGPRTRADQDFCLRTLRNISGC